MSFRASTEINKYTKRLEQQHAKLMGKIHCYYVPSSSCKVAPRVNEIKQRGKSKRSENREKKKKLIICVFVVDLI